MEETRIRMIDKIFYAVLILTVFMTLIGILTEQYIIRECNNPLGCDLTNTTFGNNVEYATPYNHNRGVMSDEKLVRFDGNRIYDTKSVSEDAYVIKRYDDRKSMRADDLIIIGRLEANSNLRRLTVLLILSIIGLVAYILFLHTPSSWLKED